MPDKVKEPDYYSHKWAECLFKRAKQDFEALYPAAVFKKEHGSLKDYPHDKHLEYEIDGQFAQIWMSRASFEGLCDERHEKGRWRISIHIRSQDLSASYHAKRRTFIDYQTMPYTEREKIWREMWDWDWDIGDTDTEE